VRAIIALRPRANHRRIPANRHGERDAPTSRLGNVIHWRLHSRAAPRGNELASTQSLALTVAVCKDPERSARARIDDVSDGVLTDAPGSRRRRRRRDAAVAKVIRGSFPWRASASLTAIAQGPCGPSPRTATSPPSSTTTPPDGATSSATSPRRAPWHSLRDRVGTAGPTRRCADRGRDG